MQNARFTRCLIMLVLVAAMVASLAIPAFAADVYVSYIDWTKTSKDFTVYKGAKNLKMINSQEATIKGNSIDYDTSTNGWGFRVVYKGDDSNNTVTIVDPDEKETFTDVALRTYWLNGNYTIHPQYRSGYGGKGTYHYVAARLDDDSADGQYSFTGYFNSDYT